MTEEPRRIQFHLPGLPRMTNPSGRPTHWAVRAKEAKHWKHVVWLATLNQKPPEPWKKAKLMLVRYSAISPDFDGLVSGFKHVIDGLVEAGIIANDKYENIGQPTYHWEKAKPRHGRIFVSVEEIRE